MQHYKTIIRQVFLDQSFPLIFQTCVMSSDPPWAITWSYILYIAAAQPMLATSVAFCSCLPVLVHIIAALRLAYTHQGQ